MLGPFSSRPTTYAGAVNEDGGTSLRRWILDTGQKTVDETEKSDKQRIRDLERALKRAEMERDVLKEAVGIFSQRPK